MSLIDYPGFILSAFLFVTLIIVTIRARRFRVMMMGRLCRLHVMLADAQEALRRMGL